MVKNMAANDYHVIAYQILLYLYDCLKKGIDPNEQALNAYRELHNINIRYWSRILFDLEKKGYIEYLHVIPLSNVEWKIAQIKGATSITGDGVEYLVDNSLMQKIKNLGMNAIQGMISTLGGNAIG